MSVKHLYGEFSENQIAQTKKSLRGSIFFLLLCVDPKTSWEYKDVDVNKCFNGLLLKIGGLNKLLMEQPEVVTTMSLLQAALMEFNNPEFNYSVYRKLILDAGAEIERLREEE
jgi:hypothetical protein